MKIKNALSLLAAALMIGCGGGSDEPSRPSVTLDGDSIAFGLGLPVKPADMLRNHGFEVVDKTAVGLLLPDMVAGYSAPYADAPADHYPNGPQPAYSSVSRSTQFVVLQAGANDVMFAPETFEASLVSAVRTLQAEGRTVVLTGITQITPEPPAWREANEATHRIARDFGLRHAGWDSVQITTIDGIHPDEASMRQLVQRLVTQLH